MTLVVDSEAGDVKVLLKNGRVIEASEYQKSEDYTFQMGSLTIHFGPVIIVNSEVFRQDQVARIMGKKRRVEEVIVWSPHIDKMEAPLKVRRETWGGDSITISGQGDFEVVNDADE